MIFHRTIAAAVLYLCALPAIAQEAEDEPFRLQTALDLPDWLKVSGSFRPRYETLHNQFNAGRTGDDQLLGSQSLLRAEIDTGVIFVGAEMLDARVFVGDAGGSAAGEVDALEPVQIYLAWRPKDFLMKGAALDVMAGRFTMDIGSRRLVSRSGFRNVLAGFEGVRGVWTSADKIKVTGFYVAPVNRAPSDVQSALDNEVVFNPVADETYFYGWSVEAPLPLSIAGEVYLFNLDEDDGEVATRNRDFSTVGVRFKRAPKATTWDFDLEYARQTGTVRNSLNATDVTNLEHDASMLHAEAGWTIDAPWSPRLSLHYDLVSGDNSPSDRFSERFDPLFGDRAFELGPTSIYAAIARTNLDSPGIRLELKPNARNELMGMLRQVKLESATDSFGNSGVRDPTGASGDHVGSQLELRWRHHLIPDSLRLTFGGAALLRGDFLKTAPNATREGDTYFGYTELLFVF